MKKEAFNKENPIELMSQLMKVLNREGLEDSVDLIKRHKVLKAINDEWQDSRRTASSKPSFPQIHLGGMKSASEKKASPSLFDQLEFASGSEKKRLLTEMSDYGVNIMRGQFSEMGLSRQEQEAVLLSALKEAQAARLKANKDSLKAFGRMRMVKHPVMDSNGNKIRLSKKLRFGIFFQLVGKGFIK